jgi:hypothetical protein
MFTGDRQASSARMASRARKMLISLCGSHPRREVGDLERWAAPVQAQPRHGVGRCTSPLQLQPRRRRRALRARKYRRPGDRPRGLRLVDRRSRGGRERTASVRVRPRPAVLVIHAQSSAIARAIGPGRTALGLWAPRPRAPYALAIASSATRLHVITWVESGMSIAITVGRGACDPRACGERRATVEDAAHRALLPVDLRADARVAGREREAPPRGALLAYERDPARLLCGPCRIDTKDDARGLGQR